MSREDAPAMPGPDDEGPIGIFNTWRALYATVVVYALLLIVIFYVLSVTLDFSGP